MSIRLRHCFQVQAALKTIFSFPTSCISPTVSVVPVDRVPPVRQLTAGCLHHLLHHGPLLQIRWPRSAGQDLPGRYGDWGRRWSQNEENKRQYTTAWRWPLHQAVTNLRFLGDSLQMETFNHQMSPVQFYVAFLFFWFCFKILFSDKMWSLGFGFFPPLARCFQSVNISCASMSITCFFVVLNININQHCLQNAGESSSLPCVHLLQRCLKDQCCLWFCMQQTLIVNLTNFLKHTKYFYGLLSLRKQQEPKIIYVFNASQLFSFKASNLFEHLLASRLGKILSL